HLTYASRFHLLPPVTIHGRLNTPHFNYDTNIMLVDNSYLLIGLTYASPAPKANEDLAKTRFYTEMAKAKNAMALDVRVNAVVRCR
ncbi:MAG: hypothetical protein J7K84_11735, partial [Deltaproteobacteria bacterium]|nr:hypothetical protein [Deltaproteobacteria bacterium]